MTSYAPNRESIVCRRSQSYQIMAGQDGHTIRVEQRTWPRTRLTEFEDALATNGIEQFHLTGIGIDHGDRAVRQERNAVGLEKFVHASAVTTEFVFV